MHRIVIALTLAILATGCGKFADYKNETALAAAKKVISEKYIDPKSVQFFDIKVKRQGDMITICGKANGKNGFGGYSQPDRFVYSAETVVIENTKEPELAELFDRLWRGTCEHP